MFSGLRNYFSNRHYDHPDYGSQQSWPTRHKVSNWLSGIHKSSRNKDPYWKGYEDDKRYYSSQYREHANKSYPHQSGYRTRQRHNSMPNMRAASHYQTLPPMKDERPRQSSMYGNYHQPMYPYQQRSHNEYPIMPQYHSKNYEPQSQYMNQFQSPLRQNNYNHSGYPSNNYSNHHPNRFSSIANTGNGNTHYNQYMSQMNPYHHSHHPQQHQHNYNSNNNYQRQRYPSNYI